MLQKIGDNWRILGICVLLAGIIWFVFGQTRAFPFVNYDDPEYVYQVPEINHGLTAHGLVWAFTRVPSPNWYPLTNISHMCEAQFYHMNAGGYHLTNVILHTIGAILLFLVLWSATGAMGRAAFVAALFAIHPLRVESVAWITERKDVLSGVFFMLTLGAYLFYARKTSLVRYLTVMLFFACGLMSKPMLVTTPAVLLLLDYWPLGRMQSGKGEAQSVVAALAAASAERRNKASAAADASTTSSRGQKSEIQIWVKLIAEKIPLFALSALSAAATVFTQTVAESSLVPPSLPWRIENAFVSLIVYIRQTFWPTDLAVFYPHPHDQLKTVVVLGSAALVITISVVAWIFRQKAPYVLTGWLWFLVMLSPVLGVVQAGLQGHADRFTYLPQIGLLLAVTWLIADVAVAVRCRREVAATSSAIVIVLMMFVGKRQTTYWKDSESLWSHAIAVTKDNAFAHASLADLLLRRGRVDDAITHCQDALRIEPRDADAHNNLGLAFLQKGNEAEAAAQFEQSLQINPNHPNAGPNLAWILATSVDPSHRNGARAVQLAENVLHRSGHPNAIVLRILAAAYAESGRFSDAVNAAQHARELALTQNDVALANDLQRNINNYEMNLPLRSYAPAP